MASEKLTALKVKSLSAPGRYGDGGGLSLQVRAAGKDRDGEDKPPNRSWLFRYMLDGRARQMGLGPAGDVTLAQARSAAQAARRLLLARVDPIEHREKDQAAKRAVVKAMSFKVLLHCTAVRAVASAWMERLPLSAPGILPAPCGSGEFGSPDNCRA
jgi:hypothetical protein